MSLGQILLILLSIALFTTVGVNVNRIFTLKSQAMFNTVVDSNALALGQYLLSEVWTKEFDEATVNSKPDQIPESFVSYTALGKESENFHSTPYFDDVDDYNNLSTVVTFAENDYRINGSVYYTNLQGDSLITRTKYKMVVFRVHADNDPTNRIEVKQMMAYLP